MRASPWPGSYIANPDVGVLVAVAIAVHNIPEEFAIAVPAVALRRLRFLIGAAIVSALAGPIGALIGLTGVELYPSLNAAFLSFAAGAMISRRTRVRNDMAVCASRCWSRWPSDRGQRAPLRARAGRGE